MRIRQARDGPRSKSRLVARLRVLVSINQPTASLDGKQTDSIQPDLADVLTECFRSVRRVSRGEDQKFYALEKGPKRSSFIVFRVSTADYGETTAMAYLAPSEFVAKMVDAGESKVFMSTRDTLIRAYMAGAILALAAVFAVTDHRADRVSRSSARSCSRSASACCICWASIC